MPSPPPYVQEANIKAPYAVSNLGAAGTILLSNYEGRYLGDLAFEPFFQAFHQMGSKKVILVHPTNPELRVDSKLVDANPTVYVTGTIEF